MFQIFKTRPFFFGAFMLIFLMIPYAAQNFVAVLFLAILGLYHQSDLNILREMKDSFVLKSLFLFLLWTGITFFFSVDPQQTFSLFTKLLFLFAAGCILLLNVLKLSDQQRHLFFKILLAGSLLTLTLYAVDLFFSGPIFHLIKGNDFSWGKFSRGSVFLLLLSFPLTYYLFQIKKLYAVFYFLFLSVVMFFLPMDSLAISLIMGLLAFLFILVFKKKGALILGGGIILFMLLVPFIAFHLPGKDVLQHVPSSWEHRIQIWHYTAEKIQKHPVLGYGLDAARYFSQQHETVVLSHQNPSGGAWFVQALSLHPHNGALQIWLEVGGIGMGLFILFLGFLFYEISKIKDTKIQAVIIASLTSYLVFFLVSFGVWQNWFITTAWLITAIYFSFFKEKLWNRETNK